MKNATEIRVEYELKQLEQQIQQLEDSLETAEDFDEGRMKRHELQIKRENLVKLMADDKWLEKQMQIVGNSLWKLQGDERAKAHVEYKQLHTERHNLLMSIANEDKNATPGWNRTIEIPPENHDMKVDFRDDWQRELDERKKLYRVSGACIDFNKEYEPDAVMSELSGARTIGKGWLSGGGAQKRHEERISKQPDVAYTDISFGADIEAEEVFQQELHGIVDEMKVKLVDEKKILEGTLNPEYGKGEWSMLLTTGKNELSNSNPTEEQWKSDSQNGSLITDPTPESTPDLSTSSSTAELFNRNCPIVRLGRPSTNSPRPLCSGNSVASGIEIDATNESSECTVPMISEPMLGTPNEVKW